MHTKLLCRIPVWKIIGTSQGNAFCLSEIVQQIPESAIWKSSIKKEVFKNFAKFTGKNLCQSLFLMQFYEQRVPGTGVFL